MTINADYNAYPVMPYCIGHHMTLVKNYMGGKGYYCPECEREKRANRPKKPLVTTESLKQRVRNYLCLHNLHNPKDNMRFIFEGDDSLVIDIKVRNSNNRLGSKVCVSTFFDKEWSLQNAFSIFKHTFREATKRSQEKIKIMNQRFGKDIASKPDCCKPDDEFLAEAAESALLKAKLLKQWVCDYQIRQAEAKIFKDILEPADEMEGEVGHTASEWIEKWNKLKASSVNSILPTDSAERKTFPIFTGVLQYFPRAIALVANQSYKGNQKHHPDKPLHWDKSKSADHSDCLLRHLMDSFDSTCDKTEELTAVAWRALALLETHLEGEGK